jgi:saccharopine dehydrogenase (NAD+, L-lysine-forming)
MSRVLIIGAGGVGNVVAHKCAMQPEVFSEICLASRTLSRAEGIAKDVESRTKRRIHTARVDADQTSEVVALIREFQPVLVIHVALPYQDLAIMDACLETGVHYLDTANYEPPDEAKFCYKWQWDYQDRFKDRGLMAVLGCGFDPGVTNIFTAYLQKTQFDTIETLDILDANAGDHGHPFATNFNPEINIREVTAPGRYFENGQWIETPALSVHHTFDFPQIGEKEIYLMYHEELESLAKNIKGARRMRFWMTFSQNYLTHLRVLENVGMTRIDAVDYEGQKIVPLQFLKAVLPDPSSLGARTKGKTNIGCVVSGTKNGKRKVVYIYQVCDHEACFDEVGSQAISYTTGVPAVVGAAMMLKGHWKGQGVFNVEELDPEPFLTALGAQGLPWQWVELEDLPEVLK